MKSISTANIPKMRITSLFLALVSAEQEFVSDNFGLNFTDCGRDYFRFLVTWRP